MIRYDLQYPISWEGSVVRTVLLNQPTAADIEETAPGFIASAEERLDLSADVSLKLLAKLSNLPDKIVGELDHEDYYEICALVGRAVGAVLDRERAKLNESR